MQAARADKKRATWHLVGGVAWPWAIAALAMVCLIWGNSLVPGDDSSSLSGGVLALLQGGLADLGLPYAWLTEHIVRKTAHFTEYLVLALLVMQALRPHADERNDRHATQAELAATQSWPLGRRMRCALVPAILVLVPSIDELVIQRLCTWGRSGQVTDILLDCCGALTGVLLTLLVSHIVHRRRR